MLPLNCLNKPPLYCTAAVNQSALLSARAPFISPFVESNPYYRRSRLACHNGSFDGPHAGPFPLMRSRSSQIAQKNPLMERPRAFRERGR